MKPTLHIYTAVLQPATHWAGTYAGKPVWVYWPGGRLLPCVCCHRYRPAKNCVVQSYYDGLNIWCAHGKGCKSEREIGAKARRIFRKRSKGQKARWKVAL